NAGQCDYAAANEVLNKVAATESRRRPGCLVRSLGWGPWQGGMVTPSLAAHFHRHNIPLISIDAGSRTFVRELTEPAGGAVETVIGSSLEGAPAHRRVKEYHTELLINSRTYPLLNGHRVKDEPVLAVVLVMEWFFRAAAAFRPELEIAACKDLRALKGVVLSRFDHEGHWLQISCREDETARGAGSIPPLHCELRSRGGRVHYTATVELKAPGQPFPEAHQAPSRNGSGSLIPAPHDFYRGDLFHGPEFQVLHTCCALPMPLRFQTAAYLRTEFAYGSSSFGGIRLSAGSCTRVADELLRVRQRGSRNSGGPPAGSGSRTRSWPDRNARPALVTCRTRSACPLRRRGKNATPCLSL